MDRERAKELINAQQPTFLQAAKKGYICPRCNNGTGKDGTGITKDPRTGRYHCFKCGLHADNLELYGLANGIQDFNQQLQGAADYYGITLDSRPVDTRQYTHNSIHTDTQPQDFTLFYRDAAARIAETDYPQRRGLSQKICRQYKIGYIPAWKHPNAPAGTPSSPRLIIPVSKYSYLARDTRAEIPEGQEEYKKSKVKSGGTVSWTFNREALRTAEKPVFIVEGEIDALSIIEAGGAAVAIGSTGNINRFAAELKDTRPAQPLLIALDNDKAGQAAAGKLETELRRQNIPFYRYNPAGSYKDANERLIADRAGLEEAIARAGSLEDLQAEEAQIREKDYCQRNCAADALQSFIDGIAEGASTACIPTGFTRLDAELDGGLYEGLYICGAISSLGKTTFVTQIADQIAQQGQDVLIFSLEMARTEIMAKSISRHTMQEVLATGGDTRDAKTTRGITAGHRYKAYSRTELDLINTAVGNYGNYAEHIFIVEGFGDVGVLQIQEVVQEHISITGRTPVVIVDYLQILAPYNERSSDKQNTDKAVLELKRISRDYKTPVIAVSSFNRENYNTAVSMQSFKESGGIEYGCDILLGLQLAGAGTQNFDATAEKAKEPRAVEVIILKNRNGKTGGKIEFAYYPMFNLFAELKRNQGESCS